jgi:hypothetical protein
MPKSKEFIESSDSDKSDQETAKASIPKGKHSSIKNDVCNFIQKSIIYFYI